MKSLFVFAIAIVGVFASPAIVARKAHKQYELKCPQNPVNSQYTDSYCRSPSFNPTCDSNGHLHFTQDSGCNCECQEKSD